MGDLPTRPSPRWSRPRCARIRAARSPPCSPGCWSAKTSSSRATCSPSTPSTGPSPSRLRSPKASGCSSVFAIRSARARICNACSPIRQPRGRCRPPLRSTSPASVGGTPSTASPAWRAPTCASTSGGFRSRGSSAGRSSGRARRERGFTSTPACSPCWAPGHDRDEGTGEERARPGAPSEKEDVMGRVKEQSRGRLAALQDILTGGGKALVDQAQSLGAGVQRRLAEVGRGVESQVSTLITALEERLSERLDLLLDRLAVSLRRDLDRVRERLRAVENRLADVPKEGVRELVAPLQAIASGAAERASAALARIEELSLRLQHTERRIAELTRETTRETLDASDVLKRLERTEQRLTDLGREVGTKLGELGALRERLTRIEGRVVDGSKDQIARAGEATGFRDRVTRLEGRLSDLSKEQVARAVETAGLRERLFRVGQRSGGPAAARGVARAHRAPLPGRGLLPGEDGPG